MMEIKYRPIGFVHSPFTDLENMPIQPAGATSAPGTVDILPEFSEGLKDVEGFSHVILIYHLHEVHGQRLTVTPFLDQEPRGIFATRAPTRPNPVGISVVRLLKVEGNRLYVDEVDILDGTPLIDLKPYVPEFDIRSDAWAGWLEKAKGIVRKTVSDDRFKG
jgi:tRNA-Thr(GGU) m(6)t(6)A37 methyltransferase TsaA